MEVSPLPAWKEQADICKGEGRVSSACEAVLEDHIIQIPSTPAAGERGGWMRLQAFPLRFSRSCSLGRGAMRLAGERGPPSTRCFLFCSRVKFLLDETALPTDAEHVTSPEDLAPAQRASQQNGWVGVWMRVQALCACHAIRLHTKVICGHSGGSSQHPGVTQ